MLFGVHWQLYGVCALGAVGALFKLHMDDRFELAFARRINPKWSGPWSRVIDMLSWVVLGSLLGTIIMQPVDATQAAITGLGWTGLLGLVPRPTVPQQGG